MSSTQANPVTRIKPAYLWSAATLLLFSTASAILIILPANDLKRLLPSEYFIAYYYFALGLYVLFNLTFFPESKLGKRILIIGNLIPFAFTAIMLAMLLLALPVIVYRLFT